MHKNIKNERLEEEREREREKERGREMREYHSLEEKRICKAKAVDNAHHRQNKPD